ncbi:MAG: UDP-N-acetylmuramate dehydrogenase [Pirellulales bacterium]
MSTLEDFGALQAIVREEEPLGRHTWLGVGGRAKWYAEPTTQQELIDLVRLAARLGQPLRVIGGGSNILVSDHEVTGVVVALDAPAFGHLDVAGLRMTVGAGARLGHVISTAVREGLAGLEALVGIPGTVGGALRTNCSSHGASIGQWVESVTALNRQGELLTLQRGDLHFGYRHSNLDGLVVVSAVLVLESGDPAEITRRMQKLWIVRRASQPSGEVPYARLFKDTQGESASKLIEMAGQKNARAGKALLHQADPNFVVLEPGATSTDVLALLERVSSEVTNQLGVDLQPAIQIW